MDYREKREALEERLIDYTLDVNNLIEGLPNTHLGKTLAGQLSRSSTSPTLNYGEAQAAESTKDFIHKMSVSLKELRETFAGIKIIRKGKLSTEEEETARLIKESNELISIFVASIKTAKKRL